MKTLIVPVDETELSERAVPVAGELAAALDAEVVLLVVDSANAERGPGHAYLESLHDRLPDAVAVDDCVVFDDRQSVGALVLAEAAERPDPAVVMATHARSGLGELVLGSTAEAVLRSSAFPVVLVGPACSTAWSPGLAVVAVDGSPLTDRVVDVAAAWAAATRSTLTVVHVCVPSAVEGAVVDGEPELAFNVGARLRASGAAVTAHTLEASRPAEAVVRWATEHGASLLIVGTERHGRLQRALLGSVSMGIVRHADCPVLVVGPAKS